MTSLAFLRFKNMLLARQLNEAMSQRERTAELRQS